MSLEIVTLLPAFNCIALDVDVVAVVVCELLEDAKPPEKLKGNIPADVDVLDSEADVSEVTAELLLYGQTPPLCKCAGFPPQ